MASGNYPPYYGQQPLSQPHRSCSSYSATTNPQTYYQTRPPSSTQPQSYPNTYDQSSNYGTGHNWYGLNSSDASVGRAAETLSNLGNQSRQAAVRSPAVGSQYAPPTSLDSYQPASAGIYGGGYSYPSQSNPQSEPLKAHKQGLPEPVASVHSVRASNSSPRTKDIRSSSSHFHPQHTHHGSIGGTQRGHSPAQRQHTPNYTAHTGSRAGPNVARQRQKSAEKAQDVPQPTAQNSTSHSALINSTATHQRTSSDESPAFTVDPAEIYDPWPEYQRRKAAEDAQRAKRRAEDEERRRALEEAETRRAEEQQKLIEQGGPQQGTTGPSAGQAASNADSSIGAVPPASGKKPKKAKVSKELANSKLKQAGSVKGSKKKENEHPTPDNEDAQILSMLKAMKAKDPERFKRLMADDNIEHEPGQSLASLVPPSEVPSPAPPAPSIRAKSHPPSTTNTLGEERIMSPPTKAPVSQLARPTVEGADRPTIWPPEKKKQLAGAAAAYLNGRVENQNKQIQPELIVQILDQNPSYILLCERLEAEGLKIDRAAFARTLLQAVPDVNSAAKKQREELKKRNGETIDLTSRDETPAMPPSIVPAGGPVQQPVETAWSPNRSTLDTRLSSPFWRNNSAPTVPKTTAERKETLSSGVAASKEEAARKRNFTDLVDLTSVSDDEPETKRMHFGPPAHPSAFQGHLSYNGSAPDASFHQYTTTGAPHQFQPGSQASYQTSSAIPRSEVQGPPSLHERLRNTAVVGSISRSKARRRASYDPRTIARDVLLATGRHPDMHHLNAHLEGLRQRLWSVTDKADLETLKWDLIDPGETLPLPSLEDDDNSVIVDAEGSEGEGKDEREDIEPKPSKDLDQARQVVPTCGRGGRPRGLAPRSTKPLASNRGDALEAGEERPRTPPNLHERFAFRGFEAINKPSGTGKLRAEDMHLTDARGTSGSPSSKGRVQKTTPTPGGSKQSTPMSGTGYSAFNQLNPDGTRKRGRPVGWRKAIHMDPSKVTKASETSKTREAPQSESEPHYQVFNCRYDGCSSQLHNLKTLRAHVNKVHGREHDSQQLYQCLWNNCGRGTGVGNSLKPNQTEAHKQQRITFPTQPEWWTDLEEVRLTPIAWKMGDGPRSGLSDARDSEQSESYLSDAHGRQVTPRIKTPTQNPSAPDQRLPVDGAVPVYGRGRGRPPVPRATLERKALDAEEKLRTKKRMLGIGLDKGGATLANDERRQGFIDDEDFELVVSDEDAGDAV